MGYLRFFSNIFDYNYHSLRKTVHRLTTYENDAKKSDVVIGRWAGSPGRIRTAGQAINSRLLYR